MSDPRNPLIVGVTNDPSYRQDDRIPTTYAMSQLFSGEVLAANTNVDDLKTCGNYRFIESTTGLPSHIVGSTGLMTVMYDRRSTNPSNENFGSINSTDYTPSVIRQIVWPDGPTDITPYTRTYVDGKWGDWQTMGGALRRVKMTKDVASHYVQTNVMYYSFSDWALSLPDPNDAGYSLGTKVGLEQWEGTGTVQAPNIKKVGDNWVVDGEDPYYLTTSPTYKMAEDGSVEKDSVTNKPINIGPTIYVFEVVEIENGRKGWILDTDNDYAAWMKGMLDNLSKESTTRANKDNWLEEEIRKLKLIIEGMDSGVAELLGTGQLSTGSNWSKTNHIDLAISNEQTAREGADNDIRALLGDGISSTAHAWSAINNIDDIIANKGKYHQLYNVNDWEYNTKRFDDNVIESTDGANAHVQRTIGEILRVCDVTNIITVGPSDKHAVGCLPYPSSMAFDGTNFDYVDGATINIVLKPGIWIDIKYIKANGTSYYSEVETYNNPYTTDNGTEIVLQFTISKNASGNREWKLIRFDAPELLNIFSV